MTLQRRIYFAVIMGLLLLVAVPFGIQRYRIAKTAAFCDAVEALPRSELDELASRCDRLIWERGGLATVPLFIRDASTLTQFRLVGRIPYEIVLSEGGVGIKYFKGGWRYSDLLLWGEDSSPNGDPIRVLKIIDGNTGWRVLAKLEGGFTDPATNTQRSVEFRRGP
jgi:hypothetical protein